MDINEIDKIINQLNDIVKQLRNIKNGENDADILINKAEYLINLIPNPVINNDQCVDNAIAAFKTERIRFKRF